MTRTPFTGYPWWIPKQWAKYLLILLASLPLSVAVFCVVLSLFVFGVPMIVLWVGFLIVPLAFLVARGYAALKTRFAAWLGVRWQPLPDSPVTGGVFTRFRALLSSKKRWRELGYGIGGSLIDGIISTVAICWLAAPVLELASRHFDWIGGLGESLGWPMDWRTYTVCTMLIVSWFFIVALFGALQVRVTKLFLAPSQRTLEARLEQISAAKQQADRAETTSLRQIERDLHDGPQQALLRTGLDLTAAQRRLAEGKTDEANRLLTEAITRNQDTLAAIRRISRGFAPQVLSDQGLVEALNSLAAASTVPCELDSEVSSETRFSESIEKDLYFTASEALANIAKHSGASKCTISLQRVGSQLVLEVSDNGTGGAELLPGHGLDGLRSRIESVGGTLRLESTVGTTLIATVPTVL
jgi:signal transduction histidine kinase